MNIDDLKKSWQSIDATPIKPDIGLQTKLSKKHMGHLTSQRRRLTVRFTVTLILATVIMIIFAPTLYFEYDEFLIIFDIIAISLLGMSAIFNLVLLLMIKGLDPTRQSVIEMVQHMVVFSRIRNRFRTIGFSITIPLCAILVTAAMADDFKLTIISMFVGGSIGAIIMILKERSYRHLISNITNDLEGQIDPANKSQSSTIPEDEILPPPLPSHLIPPPVP